MAVVLVDFVSFVVRVRSMTHGFEVRADQEVIIGKEDERHLPLAAVDTRSLKPHSLAL
jgi:hypothetical protein